MTSLRVVVVGATGNVGTSVVRALVADPAVASVVGVARRAPATWPASPKVTWRSADIVTDALAPVFEGADVVVHLGWLIQPSRDEAVTHAVNVDGSARVFAAAAQAGVDALVYASSVGAYSSGPKDRAVDETWATDGVQTSFYSRHKVQVERGLDRFERAHPDVRVVRLRPGLIFKREAALGDPPPTSLGRCCRRRSCVGSSSRSCPTFPGLRFQAVHADDVADAYRLAVVRDVAGAFNVAADPVLDPAWCSADLLGARPLRVAPNVLRALADVTWKPAPAADPAGLARHGAGRCRSWTRLAPARSSGWAPRSPLHRGVRRAARRPAPRRRRAHAAARRGGRRSAAVARVRNRRGRARASSSSSPRRPRRCWPPRRWARRGTPVLAQLLGDLGDLSGA